MATWMRSLAVLAVIAPCVSAGVRAQSLTVGDPAPKLEVASFVKGEPVARLEPGKCYVVEFWATWCGPCRVSIPHLTELQKKHSDVAFIGVSIWEEGQDGVKPFVEKMGDKMAYRVAIDSIPKDGKANDGAMARNWMRAAGENGIPSAFVVNKDGRIAWIGHPMNLDEPLEKIVTGSWDLTVAIAEHKKQKEMQANMEKVSAKLGEARKSKDPKKLLDAIADAVKEVPSLEDRLGILKFVTLMELGQNDKALELGKHLSNDVHGKNANGLNSLAWALADPDSKLKLEPRIAAFAVEVAERADHLSQGKSPMILDTLGCAYFKNGKIDRAIETQERAVDLAKGTEIEKQLRQRLEKFKDSAKK